MDSLVFKPEMFGKEVEVKPTIFYTEEYLPFIEKIQKKLDLEFCESLWLKIPKLSTNSAISLFTLDNDFLKNEMNLSAESLSEFKKTYLKMLGNASIVKELKDFYELNKEKVLVEIKIVPEDVYVDFKLVKDLFYENMEVEKLKYFDVYNFKYAIIDFNNFWVSDLSFLSNFSSKTIKKLKETYCFDITENLDLSLLQQGDIVKFDLDNCTVYYSNTNSFQTLKVYNSKKGLYIIPKPSKKRIYLPLEKFDLESNFQLSNTEKAKIFQDASLINKKVKLNSTKRNYIIEINKFLDRMEEHKLLELLKFFKGG